MFPPAATIERRIERQRQQPHQPLAASSSNTIVTKSGGAFKPLRQVIEEERIEDILRSRKQDNVIKPQRIGARPTASGPRAIPPHPSLPVPYIDERLRLRIVGDDTNLMDVDSEKEDTGVQRAIKSTVSVILLLHRWEYVLMLLFCQPNKAICRTEKRYGPRIIKRVRIFFGRRL